jgi:hypothetical protein
MLYHPVKLNTLPTIKKELLELASSKIDLSQQTFTYGQGVRFFLSSNSLKKELIRLKLINHIYKIAISVTIESKSPIHVDSKSNYYTYSLNIPLSGFENTFLSHYQPKDEKSYKNKIANDGFIYSVYEEDNCNLIQKIETLYPALVNTSIPHSFENLNSIPRIMLMIRFNYETFDVNNFIDKF